MESSELKLDIKTVVDDKQPHLYFGKYRYKLILSQRLAGVTRYFKLDDFITGKYKERKYYVYNSVVTFHEYCAHNSTSVDDLRKLVEWRDKNSEKGMFRCEFNSITFYTNDKSIIDSHAEIYGETSKTYLLYERVNIKPLTKDVIYRKKPKYNYRAYLKSAYLNQSQWENFKDDLITYNISPNSNLEKKKFKITGYISYSDFIEFDNESTISILYLKYSSLIKRICRVEGFQTAIEM